MSDEVDLTRVNENFGGNVRTRREALGWSQSELARRMNDAGWSKYSQVTVARTEDSSRSTRLDEALALAQVLDVELSTLLQESGHAAAVGNLRSALQGAKDAAAAAGIAANRYAIEQMRLDMELGKVRDYVNAHSEDIGGRETRALHKLMDEARQEMERDYVDAIREYVRAMREGSASLLKVRSRPTEADN